MKIEHEADTSIKYTCVIHSMLRKQNSYGGNQILCFILISEFLKESISKYILLINQQGNIYFLGEENVNNHRTAMKLI